MNRILVKITGATMTLLFAFLSFIPYFQSKFPESYRVPFFAYPVRITMIATLLVALILMGLLFRYRMKIDWRSERATILFFIIVFGFEMITLPPLGSEDIFLYIGQGRIAAIWHQNPYLVPFEQFPSDPFFAFVYPVWRSWPAVYGPLWLTVEGALASIGRNLTVENMMMLFRFSMFMVYLFSVWIFWKIVRMEKQKYPEAITLLFAWNPVILFETVNNAHNEGLMVLFLLSSLYVLKKKKYSAAGYILLLSGLVKYSFFALLPVWWISVRRSLSRYQKITTIMLGILIIVVAFVPWWEGRATFDGFIRHSQEVSLINAPLVMVILLLISSALGIEKFIFINIISGILLMLVVGIILFRQSHRAYSSMTSCVLILAGIFFFIAPNTHPWYMLWFLPLFLLEKRYGWFWLFSVLGIMNYLSFGFLNSLLLAMSGAMLLFWQKSTSGT